MGFKWKGTALGAIAAPFTGGLSLAGGYLYDANKQQNEANKKAVDRANAYDMYTWDLANQYNDPKAQMARLKAAGLNPNLVYGSGNVTGNTTGVAGSNGVASQEVFNGITKGMQTAQAGANLVNTWKNNQLLSHQMEKTDADRAWVEAQTRDLNNYLDGTGPSTRDFGRKIKDIFNSLFGQNPTGPKGPDKSSIGGRIGTFLYDLLGVDSFIDSLNGPNSRSGHASPIRKSPFAPYTKDDWV